MYSYCCFYSISFSVKKYRTTEYLFYTFYCTTQKRQSLLHSDSASHFFLFILPSFFYFSLINDLTAKNCHIHFRGLDLIRINLINIFL
mgnify:FL=1